MIIKISSKVRAFFVFINILASCQSAVAAVALEGESQLQVRSILPEPSLYQDFQTYIRFSYAAGCNETIIEKVFPLGSDWDKLYPSEMVKSAYSANTTGAGYLALNHQLKAIIVSFRGTATKQLWYQDFKFWGNQVVIVPVPPDFLTKKQLVNSKANGALVHFGFQQTYTTGLRDLIQPALNVTAKAYPSYKIIFTGHSLGAALTELAAVDYYKNTAGSDDASRIQLINYASPRVGNEAWASFIDSLPFAKNSYRLVRYGDPVPHLPPEFLSYRHSFQQYSILPNNQILSCNQYKSGSHDCIYRDYWEMSNNIKVNQHDSASYLTYFNQSFVCRYD